MLITETKLKDCFIIECDRFYDNRGFFQELYSSKKYEIFKSSWNQINCSVSHPNVIRGIHQSPCWKLVTCVSGAIYDVVIDIKNKQHIGTWLFADCTTQILIPPNYGHAFYANKESVVIYTQSENYNPNLENNYRWDSFGIEYPKGEYIISDKDLNAKYIA